MRPGPPRRLASRPVAGAIAPAIVIAAAELSSVVWILRDRRVWPWDQAWYGTAALDLWQAHEHGAGAWLGAMVAALGSKPPLLVWTGQFFVPLSGLTHGVEPALLLLNVVVAAATLGLVYVTGRRMGAPRPAALAGVALCGGASLFIGLTHEFLVETVQGLTAVLAMLVAQAAPRWSAVRTLALAVLTAALALLAKSSSVVFVAPALLCVGAAVVVTVWRRRPLLGRGDGPILAASVLVVVAAITWYTANWRGMVQHAIDATTGEAAQYYGSAGGVLVKLGYWTTGLARAVTPFSALGAGALALVAAGLVIALARVLVGPRAGSTLFGVTFAVAVPATLLLYSLQRNEDTRFLAPLVPVLGVLAAWSLAVIGRPPLDAACLVALLVNGVIGHAYAHGHDPLRLHPSPWLIPVHAGAAEASRLARAVRLTCPPAGAGRTVVVAVEYPSLNPPSASFYSAKMGRGGGPRCHYVALGYAESDARRALERLTRIAPEYVVTVPVESMPQPDVFNRVSAAVAGYLVDDPEFTLVPGSGADLLIYKKRAP